MQRVRKLAMVLAGLLALSIVGQAPALVIAPPPPGPQRVAKAERIVVGRIVALEDRDVDARPFPKSTKKISYRIAVLKITENLKGGKEEKTLRVGFPAPPESKSDGGVIRPKGPRFATTFKVGQDGLFYLTKHFQQSFFVAPMYYDYVSSERLNFDDEVALTRVTIKLGDQPAKGLESKDREVRFYAAAIMIQRYRTFRGGAGKTEPIEAKESKLILDALADADWNRKGQISPWNLFTQLGLTPKDGWTFPTGAKTAADYHQAARAWLREHAATYRIQRIVNVKPGRR